MSFLGPIRLYIYCIMDNYENISSIYDVDRESFFVKYLEKFK